MTIFSFTDRAGETTVTTGQGAVTLAGAIDNSFFTFIEAGIFDQQLIGYLITESLDFEVGYGTFTLATPALSRDIIIAAKIGGTAGTTALTLSTTAQVYNVAVADQLKYDHLENYFLAAQF